MNSNITTVRSNGDLPVHAYNKICDTGFFKTRYDLFDQTVEGYLEGNNYFSYLDYVELCVTGNVTGDLAADSDDREEVIIDRGKHFDEGQRERALNDVIERIIFNQIPLPQEITLRILSMVSQAFSDESHLVRGAAVDLAYLIGSGDLAMELLGNDTSAYVRHKLLYPRSLERLRSRKAVQS